MSRIKKEERQQLLKEKLNSAPFTTDEELATYFGVSVPTIRLDRIVLGIPELRERMKAMVKRQESDKLLSSMEGLGDVIDLTHGESGISVMKTTADMVDATGYVESHYLFAQADALAKAVLGTRHIIAGVGNIKYKSPVKANVNLVAKAEIVRKRDEKFFIWVTIKDKTKEVFRAKFIMESIE